MTRQAVPPLPLRRPFFLYTLRCWAARTFRQPDWHTDPLYPDPRWGMCFWCGCPLPPSERQR